MKVSCRNHQLLALVSLTIMQSLVLIPLLFAAVVVADIGLDLRGHSGIGGLGAAGLHGRQIVGVSQVHGPARVSQVVTPGLTQTLVSHGPTVVSRRKIAFTPGTTTIRRDIETDVTHSQHSVDHVRTDQYTPQITTVQHNAIRPVDITHARTHHEVHNSVQHIPHVSHSSHQRVSHSHDSIVHPQVHHAGHGHIGHY